MMLASTHPNIVLTYRKMIPGFVEPGITQTHRWTLPVPSAAKKTAALVEPSMKGIVGREETIAKFFVNAQRRSKVMHGLITFFILME